MKSAIPSTPDKNQNEADYTGKYLTGTIVATLILITAMTGCNMNANTSARYQQVPHINPIIAPSLQYLAKN